MRSNRWIASLVLTTAASLPACVYAPLDGETLDTPGSAIPVVGWANTKQAKVRVEALLGTNLRGTSGREWTQVATFTAARALDPNNQGAMELYAYDGTLHLPPSAWYVPCADLTCAAQARVRLTEKAGGPYYATFTEAGRACVHREIAGNSDYGEAGKACSTGNDLTLRAASPVLDVMSFNVRIDADGSPNTWTQRLPRIVAQIRAHAPSWGPDRATRRGPDLIAFQEVVDGKVRDDLVAALGDTYHHVGRDRGDGEAAPVFYRKDRFVRLETREYVEDYGRGDGHCEWQDGKMGSPRVTTMLRLRDKHTGATLVVAGVHWTSSNSCFRHNQADRLADELGGFAHPGDAQIVMGDFNDGHAPDGHWNGSVQRFLGRTGLVSAWHRVHGANPPAGHEITTSAHYGDPGDRMIDFVFVDGGSKVLSADVERVLHGPGGQMDTCPYHRSIAACDDDTGGPWRYASDHLAVTARIWPSSSL